ncbi:MULTISPECIES: P27 family phage terminase small subunit [Priestia]|uniref:Uncharacterized protein n=2 Tax=Priestia TaxID=2800373 RepID=A0A0V8JPE3_9BACI|nr:MULTISPECIES: P27 family phage terminase small subunit [Priestia]KSU88916.1 hypothetical protein AS180_05300 [Priestia veravalensis]MDW8515830.1 P27 family phage terminase small subunit [Priestia flexa]MED4589432.1 P27 family phage terminase small subunit [Priestia flexa]SCC02903.1 Phage terminase, small subunit [Priestia flexa]
MGKTTIRKSLLEQLENRGFSGEVYRDLVNDYMNLWDNKNALQKDIKERGVVFKDRSSVGVEMYKNNPSVKDQLAVNKQMLQILKDLSLNIPVEDDEDEDDLT